MLTGCYGYHACVELGFLVCFYFILHAALCCSQECYDTGVDAFEYITNSCLLSYLLIG